MKMKKATYNLIINRRSIRKFLPQPIDMKILAEVVNAARLAPSAANVQPLEYVVVDDKDQTENIFPLTTWAGYIQPEGTPPAGQRPTAYVAVVVNQEIARSDYYLVDMGLAVENLILAAAEQGIGSCIIGACDKEKIGEIVNLPSNRKVELVIALGYPAEKPVAEDAESDSIKYYQDSRGRLHVPKRHLKAIMQHNRY
ncbi:MAG: nitroreductase family protein [Actinomycetia bacterium]|nr:nitroreductase family protein [Actinomycetes bacterium]